MLNQYGPDLLVQCEAALEMSRELVSTWLETYMFKGQPNGSTKAKEISLWLADHKKFKSHARHIPRSEIENHGLTVSHLEDNQDIQNMALSVFHATTHAFAATPAVKIVENHVGRAFIKQHVVQPTSAM